MGSPPIWKRTFEHMDASSFTRLESYCGSMYAGIILCTEMLKVYEGRKQVAVATAQILLQRFWYVSSMKQFGIGVRPLPCLHFHHVHTKP